MLQIPNYYVAFVKNTAYLHKYTRLQRSMHVEKSKYKLYIIMIITDVAISSGAGKYFTSECISNYSFKMIKLK